MFQLNDGEWDNLRSQIVVRLEATRGRMLLKRWWYGPPQGLADRPCKPPGGAFIRKAMVLSDRGKGSVIAVRYDTES